MDYYVNNSVDLSEKFRDYLHESINHDNPKILIAKNENIIVGFITYSIEKEAYFDTKITQYGSIKELCVAEKERGKSIGAKLMAAVEDFFINHKLFDIKLTSSFFNKDALAFYEKLGYSNRHSTMFKRIKPKATT
ncbi:MAG TPA: hypothetical protein DEG44_00535 [Candidatus Kerfeldbacteria bacterium]|nr:hypothetical protein [Candidatus Kerfeldbacteria bacterium]